MAEVGARAPARTPPGLARVLTAFGAASQPGADQRQRADSQRNATADRVWSPDGLMAPEKDMRQNARRGEVDCAQDADTTPTTRRMIRSRRRTEAPDIPGSP